MRLFLIRHAHAKDCFPDEDRPLSEFGISQIRKLSDSLARETFAQIKQIWHSPYLRARQTAELLAENLGLDAPLHSVSKITPYGDPDSVAREIAAISCFDADLAVVAHNPFLESLAATLMDKKSGGYITFKKGTIAAFTLVENAGIYNPLGTWTLDFLVSPSVFPRK